MRRRQLILLASAAVQARAADATDVAVEIITAPTWVRANGQNHVLYELHVTNLGREPIELDHVEMFAEGRRAVRVLDAAHLDSGWMRRPGIDKGSTPPRRIGAGLRAIVFVNSVYDFVPAWVGHTVHCNGFAVNVAPIHLRTESPLVLRPPLRGDNWVAMNGLGTRGHHRTSLLAEGGRAVVPQRYAVDFVRLGEDGRVHRMGDGSNSGYYGYGAEVLAVADARVEEAKDGRPDVPPFQAAGALSAPGDEMAGNYVTLALDNDRWALYGHLKPGSVRVKKGQRVKRGEVLGTLGNSGNSSLPHLHFQVTDRPSPLLADGRPYVFDSFAVKGNVGSIEGMLEGKGIVKAPSRTPAIRRRELPEDQDVVRFL